MKLTIVILVFLASFTLCAQTDPKSTEMNIDLEGLSIKRKVKKGDKIRLENVNFRPGSTQLLPRSRKTLAELIELMNNYESIIIQIQGHICCNMNDTAGLSTARARTVYYHLIENGIHHYRLSYVGFGGTRAIYPIPESGNYQREANRRVEIEILNI